MGQNEQLGGLPGEAFEGASYSARLEKQELTGIDSWLLLYIILSFLSVLIDVVGLMIPSASPLDSYSFETQIGEAEILGGTSTLFLAIGLFLLFRRSKRAPAINIIALLLSILAGLVRPTTIYSPATELYWAVFVLSTPFNIAWIIYFLRSRRVRYTCVRYL